MNTKLVMQANDAPSYAELHCLSNFSFLRGASHPQELVLQAAALGYQALAITDECSMAGVVRAHEAAKAVDLHLIIGSEFRCQDVHLVALAPNHAAYSELCALITKGRRAAPKGEYALSFADFADLASCLVIWLPSHDQPQHHHRQGKQLQAWFAGRLWIGVHRLLRDDDQARLEQLQHLSTTLALKLVAVGDVHMHQRRRKMLQDTLTAIAENCTIAEIGRRIQPNGERHLRPRTTLKKLYPAALLAETIHIAERCSFNLQTLNYQYPHEVVPAGTTATEQLRALTLKGMRYHWPDGTPLAVRKQIVKELRLIARMRYESYFLTVQDIVAYARAQDILCQGRGSAANSAVCFCLGITAVDPSRSNLLFERFISEQRNEPPDIDVDFEHQRREEVMQYIYRKYGRQRAALAATVVSYRRKSAIRDVGKALGLSAEQLTTLTSNLAWWDDEHEMERQISAVGLDAGSRTVQLMIKLIKQLMGFPRHLSQHTGGFVISEAPLHTLVPVENASMVDRTVIQWDKDDLESLGLLKVDVLALGMLSALKRSFDLVNTTPDRHWQHRLALANLPAEDAATYRMMQKADTIGVFQIESRAQQAMLPKLKPACFYDLVIEIAIVRPGPIQGDMVHPYLRRRNGQEVIDYMKPELEPVLKRTYGVPIFQEQVMEIAMVAAGFSAGQADQLRRAMAAWKRKGGLEPFREELLQGMLNNGYEPSFAERIFEQIKGFGEYGFPESHAASFALLAYASAWFKCHYPDVFTCALLNSLPMGFYSPAQLVKDARDHGVPVAPVDVCASDWESTLLPAHGIRLGLNRIKRLSKAGAKRLVAARTISSFENVDDLRQRAALDRRDMTALAQANALRSLIGDRHQAYWGVLGARSQIAGGTRKRVETLPLPAPVEHRPQLPTPSASDELFNDYDSLGLSLEHHPIGLLAGKLSPRRVVASAVRDTPHGRSVYVVGLVALRQRPATAKGVIFITLEDETGMINIVVWSRLAETQRDTLLGSRLMGVRGRLETDGNVHHVIAERLFDHSHLLGELKISSRNFH